MTWTLSAFADEAGDSTQMQIAATRKAGLTRLDIRGIEGFNIAGLPKVRAREIKQQLDDAKFTVQMFGSPIGKIDISEPMPGEHDKLRHLGDMAEIFACRNVRIFSYYNAKNVTHDEWQSKSLERLSALKNTAQEVGLVLYHENERHIFGDLGRDVLTIAENLRGDNFKTIFDFDNFNQSGEDVWQVWELLRDVTDAFHLKDSSAQNQHVPIGQGAGQAREILSDARARGWSGPLAVEPHLKHSAAVMATGPSGESNQQFSSMNEEECFVIACQAARELLQEIGAPLEA